MAKPTGPPTLHGISTFAPGDRPRLASSPGLPDILADVDALIGAYKIQAAPVGVGGAGAIDFQTIPQTFAHLLLDIDARGDAAATNVGMSIRLNNDSNPNYSSVNSDVNNTGLASNESLGATAMIAMGLMPAATAPANGFASIVIEVLNYAGATHHKHVLGRSSARLNAIAGTLYWRFAGGVWFAAPAAINRLTLIPAAGNFANGSLATLYGLP